MTIQPGSPTAIAGRRTVVYLTALYFGVLATRLVWIVWPPARLFYNIDELETTLSCLDRFLGVPPTSLQWPGSILQMFLLPVILVDFLARGAANGGMTGWIGPFAAYLAGAYANPVHSVLLLRLLVAAIASTAPVLAFLIARSLHNSVTGAGLCAFVVAFTPVFARQSAMAMGEAVAIAFAFGTIFAIVRYGGNGAFAAGLLFAAALAARITVAGLLMLPLALLAFDGARPVRARTASGVRLLAGTGLGFLFWCPYVWTEPVRFGKALLGHVRPQSSLHVAAFARAWGEGMGWSFSFVAFISVVGGIFVAMCSSQKGPAVAALLAAAMISLPLLLSGNDVFPRYFLPLLPCVAVLLAVTLGRDTLRSANAFGILATVCAIACLGLVAEVALGELPLRQPDELSRGVDEARSLAGVTALYLPEEALYLYRFAVPGATYGRMRERANEQMRDHDGLFRFLQMRGIPANTARVLLANFTEDEQALEARLAAASSAGSPAAVPLYFYFDPATIHGVVAERLTRSDYTIAEAEDRFRLAGRPAILLPHADAALGSPVWKGAHEWFLYRHQ